MLHDNAKTASIQGMMATRQLGNTGETVSVLGLGGSHIGKSKLSGRQAIRLIRAALDRGLNFMDNSWDYNDGESEDRMGRALRDGYREKAFLMTKVDGRTKKEAARQIDESLQRLRVEYVDLMQHHEVIRFDDVDRIFSEGGAMEAFLSARKAGKIRYIGFTGHKDPQVHLYMLAKAKQQKFRFDTVQMPLNVFDAHFRSFEAQVLPVLLKEEIGVLGMKSMGNGVLLKSKAVTPVECLHYALNLPVSVVITGIDSEELLEQALEAALTFKPLSPRQVSRLLAKTADAAQNGKYELYKTTSHFDSTAENPKWLGEDPPRVKALAGS